jgi:hypothetical protein
MTSSTPGLGPSPDMNTKAAQLPSGIHLVGVPASVEGRLHLYLSRPRMQDGPPASEIMLSSHMFNSLRHQYAHLSRQRSHSYFLQVSRSQFSLFYP